MHMGRTTLLLRQSPTAGYDWKLFHWGCVDTPHLLQGLQASQEVRPHSLCILLQPLLPNGGQHSQPGGPSCGAASKGIEVLHAIAEGLGRLLLAHLGSSICSMSSAVVGQLVISP